MDIVRASEISVPSEGEFLDILLNLIRDSYVYDFPVCFILVEPDTLDDTTSSHGLLAGESLLAEFAPVVRRCFRGSDICQRLAGNRFVVVLGGAPVEVCPRIAETMRGKLEAHAYSASYLPENQRRLPVSVGLASTQDTNLPLASPHSAVGDQREQGLHNAWQIATQMLGNAVQAVEAARANGGNRIQLSAAYPGQPPAAAQ